MFRLFRSVVGAAVVLLATQCAHSQAPDAATQLQQAKSAYLQHHYAEAGRRYDQALRHSAAPLPSAATYYDAACAWALAGQPHRAVAYLDQAVAAGWDDLPQLLEDEDLASLWTDHRGSGWRAHLEAGIARNVARLDQPLRQALLLVLERDQAPRRRVREVMTTYGLNSPELAALSREILAADSLNLAQVTAIIDEHGWPGPPLVGQQASLAAFLVIQHAPLPVQLRYLARLRAAADQGELAKANLALLEDRVRVRQGQPQLYGSQLRTTANGQLEFEPIEDLAHVDERRASVGLGPLAEYARSSGAPYPTAGR